MNYTIDGRYIQDHFPGIGRYAFNLIDALARIAPQDRFIVLHNPALKNTRFDFAALARYPNVELHRIDIPTFSIAEQYRLPFIIRRLSSALFYSPYLLKPYLSRVPSIVTLFDVIPLRLPETMSLHQRFIYRGLIQLAMRTSRRVIVPSLATRDDLAKFGTREKIVVIPLAPDSRFAPPSRAAMDAMRQKYDLSGDYVLYLGSNKPHKNVALLMQAWAHIETNQTLVIAGHWDDRYASRINHQKASIKIIRNVDEVALPALYGGATLFVFPSRYEGFGLPPLEAMACGAPVACSNIPSLREVVGDAGIFFDLNVDAMQKTLEHLLNDPGWRERLRERGLARAAQFSWERAARATLQVYQDVVKHE